jgi:predicted ATPase/DNA-binding SARP family transcriptional activator
MKILGLQLLGSYNIYLDNVPLIALKTKKGQALLSYLAVTGKEHFRSSLSGLLWPDIPEKNARANLRKTLSRLKPHLYSHLKVTRETIALRRDADFYLDVREFESGVAPGAEISQVQSAVSIYQGDFLDGFELPDATLFDDWVLAQRVRLRDMAINALQRLTTYFGDVGDYETAVDYARSVLTIEPWHEDTHRELMRLLALRGQRSAALKQYERFRELLSEELGIEPGEDIFVLYQQIRDGGFKNTKPSISQPSSTRRDTYPEVQSSIFPSSSELTSIRHNLPAQTSPLIGREHDINELDNLIANPKIRLVTIYGAGGMGKTRLAVEAAFSQLEKYAYGVYFISLAPLDHPHQMVSTIAETLGFSLHDGSDPLQQLIDYLQPKSLLLVLDNFEHLLRNADLLSKMLHAAPHLDILVTSRERLSLQGEQLFPITGIDFPNTIEKPENAMQYGAVQLFVQNALRVQPGLSLSDHDLLDIMRICRLVEGMPLAILLASAWVDILTPSQIIREISQNLDFLENQTRDVPTRHRSMRAVFDHSWNLLADSEKQIFQKLSVFRGGFTLEAARVVARASIKELRTLVSKSLLSTTTLGRYYIHELSRQYAAIELNKSYTRYSNAKDAHGAFYCTFLHQQEDNLRTARRKAALLEIKTERENVLAAWEWVVSQRHLDHLEQALESLATFLHWQGRFQEGEQAVRLAADKISDTDQVLVKKLYIRLLNWQANFNIELGRTELAINQSQENLKLLDHPAFFKQDMRKEKATALYCLGFGALRHDYNKARTLWLESYKLYRAAGDRWGMAHVLGYLSMIAWELGQYDEAKKLIEENLVIQQSLENDIGIGDMFSTLGWIALTQGQIEQAEQLAYRCTIYYREIGDQARIAKGLRDLAAPKIFLGKFPEADTLLGESAALFTELGGSGDLVFTNILLGANKAHLGQYGNARSREEKALKLAKKFEDRAGIGRAFLWLGRLALIEEGYAEAQTYLHESSKIFSEIEQKNQLSSALASLGYYSQVTGNKTDTLQYLVEALKIAIEIGAFLPLLYVIPLAALYTADRGEIQRAVELYRQVSHYSFVVNSQWCQQIFGRHISYHTGNLPDDTAGTSPKIKDHQVLWETARYLLAEYNKEAAFTS